MITETSIVIASSILFWGLFILVLVRAWMVGKEIAKDKKKNSK